MKRHLRNSLFTLLAIGFVSCSVFAQDYTVSGMVTDGDSGEPLEFAAVSLYTPDTSLVTGTVTDVEGRFSFRAKEGDYLAKVEYISYNVKWMPDIRIAGDTKAFDLGTISLGLAAEVLEEVVVTGEKSRMQLGLDKRIYNVDKDIITRNGNAADVLDNLPSVTVDLEGNVSLRGNSSVRILIDGRPSGLVGLSGSDALRSLQGDMIERVEVITNPSARYEAEGVAGIINIVLKKDQRKGFNGNFNLYGGLPANGGASAGINLRRKNLNFFANAGVRYRKSPGGGSIYNEYYGIDTTFLEQTRDHIRGGWSQNVRLGLDYQVTPNTTLTGSFMWRGSKEENNTTIIYEDFNGDYELVSISNRDEIEIETEPNLEYALNFRHLFDGNDKHELKAMLQYEDSEETEDADYVEQFFKPDGTPSEEPILYQKRLNIENQLQWLGQIDYRRPIGEHGAFEAGYRINTRNIGNDFKVEELNDNSWEIVDGLTNNFRYNEMINAAYLIYGNKTGKFDYQVGVRAEHSLIKTELINTGEKNTQNYLDWFPSAHVGYSFTEENTIQVSYSRRIRRPWFRMLNPFSSYSDARNIWMGNPNLTPQYTNSMEVTYIKYWDKASLSSSIYYRHTTDVFQRVRTINENDIIFSTPENLATSDSWGLELVFSTDILEDWKVDGNVNVYREIIDGDTLGRSDNLTWMGRLNSRVMLFDKVETQVRFNYRGPQQNPQGSSMAIAHVDFAASMDILKGKATITLSVNDVFNSRKWRGETFGENFYQESEWQWRVRSATLNFNYRLNQKKRNGGPGGGGGFDGGDMF